MSKCWYETRSAQLCIYTAREQGEETGGNCSPPPSPPERTSRNDQSPSQQSGALCTSPFPLQSQLLTSFSYTYCTQTHQHTQTPPQEKPRTPFLTCLSSSSFSTPPLLYKGRDVLLTPPPCIKIVQGTETLNFLTVWCRMQLGGGTAEETFLHPRTAQKCNFCMRDQKGGKLQFLCFSAPNMPHLLNIRQTPSLRRLQIFHRVSVTIKLPSGVHMTEFCLPGWNQHRQSPSSRKLPGVVSALFLLSGTRSGWGKEAFLEVPRSFFLKSFWHFIPPELCSPWGVGGTGGPRVSC